MDLHALSDQLAGAVQKTAQTIVAVHGRPRVPSTGIHWQSGLIATASHTVHTEDELRVTTPSGESVLATLVGRDPGLDVAVLRTGVPGVAVADIADSDPVRAGHMVLAVGTGPRASWGIVSAVGAAGPGRPQREVFSLDLLLYPGFSGGPLVDARGAVIGLATSGASRQLQLAIPAKAVSRVVDAAQRHGRVPQAYLGVSTQQIRIPDGVGNAENRDERTAVIVVAVQPDSPAAAGLLVGDVILSFDSVPIADPLDLRAVLRPERIGQSVTARVIRAGRLLDVALTLGERPARPR